MALVLALAIDASCHGQITPSTPAAFVGTLAIGGAWVVSVALLDTPWTGLRVLGALMALPAGVLWALCLLLTPVSILSGLIGATTYGPDPLVVPLAVFSGSALGWSGATLSVGLLREFLRPEWDE